ncbi:hypothetical protein L0F63_000703 [Massospora cicadina]|nr:hypothetical protein L0F63_000703 [Massospora cicadina]
MRARGQGMERSNPRISSELRTLELQRGGGFPRRASLLSPYAPFNLNPATLNFLPPTQPIRSNSWDANFQPTNANYPTHYLNDWQPYQLPNVNYLAYPFQPSNKFQGTIQTAGPIGPLDRPHPCHYPGCGRMFKRLEHLKRHFRSIHTLERPYPCRHPSCNKSFSRSDNLAQHMRIHRKSSATTQPTPTTQPRFYPSQLH